MIRHHHHRLTRQLRFTFTRRDALAALMGGGAAAVSASRLAISATAGRRESQCPHRCQKYANDDPNALNHDGNSKICHNRCRRKRGD